MIGKVLRLFNYGAYFNFGKLSQLLRYLLWWMIAVFAIRMTETQAAVLPPQPVLLPIIVKGFQFPVSWQNTGYANWQLLTFSAQKWQGLTFQLDKVDQHGHVLTEPPSATDVLATQDELVLLWNELSATPWPGFLQLNPQQRSQWLEWVIESPFLGRRYAYVFNASQPQWAAASTHDYVGYSESAQRVESGVLQVDYAVSDFTEVKSIRVKSANNVWINVLQKVQAEFSTGVLYKGLRVEINNQHIQGALLGVRDGPLRVALRLDLSIRYAGMNLYHAPLMVHHYPNAVNLPSRFMGSSIKALQRFAWLLKQPNVQLQLDLQNMAGAKVLIADQQGKLKLAQVDGSVSLQEQSLRTAPGRWMYAQNTGWQGLLNNTLPPIEGGLLQRYLQGMQVNFLYDEMPAQLQVGASVQGVPKDAVQLLAALAELPPVKGDDFQQWLADWLLLAQAGRLKKLNKIQQRVWQAWLAETAASNPGKSSLSEQQLLEQVVQSLVLDVQLSGFVGYNPEQLQRVLVKTLQQISDWQNLDLSEFLLQLQQSAKTENFDLHQMKYRPLDNTLWFAPVDSFAASAEAAVKLAQQANPQWQMQCR